jgi:WD40 repeat protein
MQITYTGSDEVLNIINGFERVEDVRFSPDNKRLAIAGYKNNRLLILDIELYISPTAPRITVTDCFEIASQSLKDPHGLFWIDNTTLIVANRGGDTSILQLPENRQARKTIHLTPLLSLRPDGRQTIYTPGSVAVARAGEDLIDILTCNNYSHHVLQSLVSTRNGFSCLSNSILLERDIEIPDGIAFSPDYHWIAVSNHGWHNVQVHENMAKLNPDSTPAALLLGTNYPHGVLFSPDGKCILTADAGAPYVNVYTRKGDDWDGEYSPELRIRVMDEATFKRGHNNPMEGGPKGIDLDSKGRILVTTCEEQPLAFFDLAQAMRLPTDRPIGFPDRPESARLEFTDRTLRRHFHNITRSRRELVEDYEQEIQSMKQSMSWRITAPLRRMMKSLRGLHR